MSDIIIFLCPMNAKYLNIYRVINAFWQETKPRSARLTSDGIKASSRSQRVFESCWGLFSCLNPRYHCPPRNKLNTTTYLERECCVLCTNKQNKVWLCTRRLRSHLFVVFSLWGWGWKSRRRDLGRRLPPIVWTHYLSAVAHRRRAGARHVGRQVRLQTPNFQAGLKRVLIEQARSHRRAGQRNPGGLWPLTPGNPAPTFPRVPASPAARPATNAHKYRFSACEA